MQRLSGNLKTDFFGQNYNWQCKGRILDDAEMAKQHISKVHQKKQVKWDLLKSSQAEFLRNGYKPLKLIETLRKELKRRHMGTLADVFTGSMFLKGWKDKEEVCCQYCLQVRRKKMPLTPEHLNQCLLNKYAKEAAKIKVKGEAVEGWEIDWETHTKKKDHITQLAQILVDTTQLNHTQKTAKIWNPRKNCYSKSIPQRTIDDLAYVFADSCTNKEEEPNREQWQQAVADLADTTHSETSLPRTTQKLAAILINAKTNMFNGNLPTSNRVLPHTHADDPNPKWGQKQMTHPDINNTNYHYAPGTKQARALTKAHTDKQTGRTPKSIGFITLNPHNEGLIRKLNVAHIATIPRNAIQMHSNAPWKGPQHNQEPIAIILAVSQRAQTSEDIDTLTAAHILTEWTKKECPEATIHYSRLIDEISGGESRTTYTKRNWQNMVEDTWGWIDTPHAYAGLPTRAQADQISMLKGSARSTDALLMRAATSLFKQFAKEWEAKKVLAPPANTMGKIQPEGR
jgi:hypothetical protein